jgi:hypothetical protein
MQPVLSTNLAAWRDARDGLNRKSEQIGARMAAPLLDYLGQSYLRQSYLRHAAPNRNAIPATIASVV